MGEGSRDPRSPADPEGDLSVQPAQTAPTTGNYDVVLNWPRPLPDAFPGEHDGWTWGSGSAVFAESVDKVWVAQRAEIELPPGAEPWICACLLNRRRTNTGRRPYAGQARDYDMRRHHIVFAVDRNSETIEEWLQWDDSLSGPLDGHCAGSAQAPHQSLRR